MVGGAAEGGVSTAGTTAVPGTRSTVGGAAEGGVSVPAGVAGAGYGAAAGVEPALDGALGGGPALLSLSFGTLMALMRHTPPSAISVMSRRCGPAG